MDSANTNFLRAAAPKWSLAGDDCLLNILQNTHQRILTKCEDVNTKLKEMTSALDDASINLQNVNNRFMALSNSQFIESRVYDDEEDAADCQPVKQVPQQPIDELSLIKTSLAILERTHETTEILDDSDSDSDTEISVILKPKDLYSHRPLPYIIGTPSWKNKWHAGLIEEDSDTDSTTSKHDERELDQYSDTESEVELPRERAEDQTISETSSSLTSSHRVEVTPVAQKPADIAAELARRLGGAQPMKQEEEEYSPPAPVTRKVYKPEKPAASTIFFDEPPPLDEYVQEDVPSDDGDIFAEINRNKPYTQRATQNNLAEDLFSFDSPVAGGDIFSDFAQQETKPSKQKSSLFEDDSEPDLFVETKKEASINNNVEKEETSSKKPVGGISLFGTNKGAESIGAAILKRNRRKSSTSGDESGSDVAREEKPTSVSKNVERTQKFEATKSKNVDDIDNASLKKEKDIFQDLFAKPKVAEKKTLQKIVKEPVKEKPKERKDITDLFKENIFDDIDDIFSSDVKIPPKESNQKSIFDDDDDDLFSEIAVKPKDREIKSKESETNNEKSIFDSDDELFSDVKTIETKQTQAKNSESAKPISVNIQSDNLVSKNVESHKKNIENDQSPKISNKSIEISNAKNIKTTEKAKERNLFDDSPQNVKSDKPTVKSKGIFDSDSEDDIFASVNKPKTKDGVKPDIVKSKTVASEIDDAMFKQNANPKLLTTGSVHIDDKSEALQSPSLFEDDETEELFVNTYKSDTVPIANTIETDIENIPPISSLEDIAKDTTTRESETTNVNSKTINDLPKVKDADVNNKDVKQNETKKPIESKEIDSFYDNLSEDDIFSTPIDISKDKNVKHIVTDVIESSQEIDKPKVEFKNDTETETKFDETKNLVAESETLDGNAKIENDSIFDDFTDKEHQTSTVEQKKSIIKEQHIFDDIFSEPPAFEKPTEPKKSKNVNALFDDDSDDESLFFKKNDVISDEKPELFASNANFDIFVSEPPAIDVDFNAKINKNVSEDDTKATKDLKASNDDDIFGDVPNLDENKPKSMESKVDTSNSSSDKLLKHDIETESDTDVFALRSNESSQNKPDISFLNEFENDDLFNTTEVIDPIGEFGETEIEKNKTKSMADVTEDEFCDMFKSKESPIKENEKKIGKLNTKNFNINVNALIPGASPKKVPKETQVQESEPKMVNIYPTNDETDNQPKATDNQPKAANHRVENETADREVLEPKAAKSITFVDKPDSGVLDNNLSKQRAKIQVKRRPSSRRARHEAVRKSAIDIDDTDNSSSFDEPVKRVKVNSKITKESDNVSTKKNDDIDSFSKPENVSNDETESSVNIGDSSNSNNNLNNPSNNHFNRETDERSLIKTDSEQKSTTKIVYILNDEDIFNTSVDKRDIFGKKKLNPDEATKSENNVFERNDNFGANSEEPNSDDIFKTMGVNTIGKSYKEYKNIEAIKDNTVTLDKDDRNAATVKNDSTVTATVKSADKKQAQNVKSSLFSDSDEELFNKPKKLDKKVNIFDSDSEDDLFSGKKRTEKQSKDKKNQEVKKEVKTSLFGDDGDDLFGDKKTKDSQQTPSTSKLPASSSKSVEPVFDDPLSMFDD